MKARRDCSNSIATDEIQSLNRKAVARLQRAIDKDYSYRDLRRVNWGARFREFKLRLEAARSPRGFADVTVQLLAPARDIHLWLEVEGNRLPTFRRRAARNVATVKLPHLVPGWLRRGPLVFTGVFEDGIRYLGIRGWPGDAPRQLEPAYRVLAAAARAGKPLIIDVRANGGGSENAAQRLAGCFVDQPVVYAKHILRKSGKFSRPRQRFLKPNKNRAPYRGRIAVLIGQGTVSSCESFAMMMKQVPGCTLIGERTAGSSGNPQAVDLGNGVTLFVPCWKDLRMDGTCLEGEGFAPDIVVKTGPSDFQKCDAVIEEALRVLRSNK